MKDGYKETAIGLIPEDWEAMELGDCLNKIVGGGTPSRKNDSFWNGKIPWATVKDLKKSIIDDTEEYITEAGLMNSASNMIPSGTIVTATRMALGKAVIFTKDVAINQDLKAIFTNPLINTAFLFHWFCFKAKIIEELGSGSTVKGVRLEVLRGLNIALPKLAEQSKIATILSTVDDKINTINESITQTQQLKNGLMQQLLTKGIGHTKFKDSPLGEIPESWEIVGLDQHIELLSGFPFKSEKFCDYESGTKLLRGINITNGRLRWNEQIDRWWDEEFDEYEKYALKEGDLVISMDGSLVGRNYARVPKQFLPLLLVQRVACIRAKENLDLEFLHQIIESPLFVTYVDAVKTSSGIPHISSKQIKEFKIPFPPFSEQIRISTILSCIDEKLDVLQEKKSEYEKLKKGLMQQLLTGVIRVKI